MVVEPGAFRTDFAGRSLTQRPRRSVTTRPRRRPRRKKHDTVHGTQPGDPAIIAAAEFPGRPALLVLGQDALNSFQGVLDAERAEVNTWENVTVRAGFSR
jgi:hypothetical protein